MSAAADAPDTTGRNLGRETHSHGSAVFDAHKLPRREAACLIGMHHNLLAGGAVADEQPVTTFLANDASFHLFRSGSFQGLDLLYKILQAILCPIEI